MSQHIYTYDPTNGLEEITGTGHVIQDSTGTPMPVRRNMKIVNAVVSDDATNDTTVLAMTGALPATPTTDGLMSSTDFKKINPQLLGEDTDLNDITDIGWYYCNSDEVAETMPNRPTDHAFFLEVGKHSGVYQILSAYDASSPKIWYRNYYDGTWGSWTEIFTTAGGTMTGKLTINRTNGSEGLSVDSKDGTASAVGSSLVVIGNNIPQGTAENSRGALALYTESSHFMNIRSTDDGNQDASLYLPTSKHGGTIFTDKGGRMNGEVNWGDNAVKLVRSVAGTASTLGQAYVFVGNNTAEGTAGNSKGFVRIYSPKSNSVQLESLPDSTSNIYHPSFPAKSGTVALTSDIPGVARGLEYNPSTNKYYIPQWYSVIGTAINLNGDIALRGIPNVATFYNSQIWISGKTSVTSAQAVTLSGTTYYYAPLAQFDDDQVQTILADRAPTSNGSTVSLCRMPAGKDGGSATEIWRIFRKSSSVYYLIADSLRESTSANLTTLIKNNAWHYNLQGVLFYAYQT